MMEYLPYIAGWFGLGLLHPIYFLIQEWRYGHDAPWWRKAKLLLTIFLLGPMGLALGIWFEIAIYHEQQRQRAEDIAIKPRKGRTKKVATGEPEAVA